MENYPGVRVCHFCLTGQKIPPSVFVLKALKIIQWKGVVMIPIGLSIRQVGNYVKGLVNVMDPATMGYHWLDLVKKPVVGAKIAYHSIKNLSPFTLMLYPEARVRQLIRNQKFNDVLSQAKKLAPEQRSVINRDGRLFTTVDFDNKNYQFLKQTGDKEDYYEILPTAGEDVNALGTRKILVPKDQHGRQLWQRAYFRGRNEPFETPDLSPGWLNARRQARMLDEILRNPDQSQTPAN